MSTPEEGHLAWHLISEHADGMAVMRPLKDNQDAHEHEHDGPGTIRNHDRLSLHFDLVKKAEVLAELAEGDPYFYDPDAILDDQNSHPIHKVHAMINIGVRDRGERWAKCANCGEPYQLTPEWTSDTVCGKACHNDYVAYLNSPREW